MINFNKNLVKTCYEYINTNKQIWYKLFFDNNDNDNNDNNDNDNNDNNDNNDDNRN